MQNYKASYCKYIVNISNKQAPSSLLVKLKLREQEMPVTPEQTRYPIRYTVWDGMATSTWIPVLAQGLKMQVAVCTTVTGRPAKM